MLRSVRKQGRGWDGVGVGWGRGRFDNGYVAVECAHVVSTTQTVTKDRRRVVMKMM